MIRPIGAIVLVFVSAAPGQQKVGPAPATPPAFNPMVVSKQPPAVCSTYLTALHEANGNAPFRRLLFVSEALASAENGAKEGAESVSKMKEAKNLTAMWAEALSGEEAWVEHMHCSAQVMFRYAPAGFKDDQESTIAVLLTVAYNQQAHARQMLSLSQKRRLTRTSLAGPTQEIADAEGLHRIELEQNDSADSISQTGMLAAAEAEDVSDQSATKIEKLLLACPEEQRIKELLEPIAADKDSLFGRTARDMLSVFADKS